ncbi:MAG: hypothetical protein ACREEA_12350 [Stellaceae bacterium]
MTTVLVFVSAIAAVGALLCGFEKTWKIARLTSAAVAMLAFLGALLSATPK